MHPYLLEFNLPFFFKAIFGAVPFVMHVLFILGGIMLMFFPDVAAGKDGKDGRPSAAAIGVFWAGLALLVFGMLGIGVGTLINDDEQEKAYEVLVASFNTAPKLDTVLGDFEATGTLAPANLVALNQMTRAMQVVPDPDTWANARATELRTALDDLRTAGTTRGEPVDPDRRKEIVTAVKTAHAEAKASMTRAEFPLRTVRVPSYGVMIMLGFIGCILVVYFRSRSYGSDPNVVIDIGIIAMLGGIIGSRLWHVVEYWNESYAIDPATGAVRGTFEALIEAAQVQKGGLVFYGGFIGAALGIWAYLKIRKLPILFYLDIAAISVPLGQAFGRIGCFLNGCCWGVACPPDHPLATAYNMNLSQYETANGVLTPQLIHAANNPVIMSQFVESMLTMLTFLLLTVYYDKFARRRGETVALLFVFYGVNRFFNQFLRADVPVYGELSSSQWFSLMTFAFGLGLWIYFRFVNKAVLPPRYEGIKLEKQGIYRLTPAKS